MSDLVERLRKGEALPFYTYDEEVLSGLAGEAADEIERLRDVVMERNKERMKLQAVVDLAVFYATNAGGDPDEPIHKGLIRHNAQYKALVEVINQYLRALDGEP